MRPIFITGIGTDVGKTIVSALLTETLEADYWKPVQAGFPTDSDLIKSLISNTKSHVYQETYLLKFPASPHIAAKKESIRISIKHIVSSMPRTSNQLIIEGAGGLMVPLNENEFVLDLIKALDARVIIVSRNYLGSINHSLLTYQTLLAHKIEILGWIFNDQYLAYEKEIADWSNLPILAIVNKMEQVDKQAIFLHAEPLRPLIAKYL